MQGEVTESLGDQDNKGVGDTLSIQEQLQQLKESQAMLLKAKADQEAEFGIMRAKMKELYLQKEDELKKQFASLEEASSERDSLRNEVKKLTEELNETKSQVMIAECNLENQIEVERRKCQEEIASLQSILKEEAGEMMQDTVKKYEDKLKKLKKLNEHLEMELLKNSDKEGVLSVVTKTLAKKVGALNAYSQSNENIPEHLDDNMKKQHGEVSGDRWWAQEDAAILRSVVVPLEEEIKALKEKLRSTDDQLRAYEAKERHSMSSSDCNGELQKDKMAGSFVSDLDSKVRLLSDDLRAEKSSRSDLEMYVDVLQTQKAALQEENDRLRKDLQEEMQSKREEDRKHDQRPKNPETDKRLASPILARLSPLRRKSPSPNRAETPIHDVTSSFDGTEPETNKETPEADTSRLTSFLMRTVEVLTTREGSPTPLSTPVHVSAERTTDANQTPECDTTDATLLGAASQISSSSEKTPDLVETAGKRLVTEREWESLQEEAKKAAERKNCDMCANYEHQLQRVQEQNKEQIRALNASKQQLERLRSSLQRSDEQRREAEQKIEQMSTDSEKHVAELTEQMAKSEALLTGLQQEQDRITAACWEQVHQLSAQLESATTEARKLQEENDTLLGKYSAHSQQLQNEVINLPDTVEELQEMMLKLKDELITAKISKEHIENNLKSEILFLKDQAMGEQQAKDTLEDSLTQEIDHLRERLGTLESVATQLEEEQSRRVEAEKVVIQVKGRLDEISKTLERQITELRDDKIRLEKDLAEQSQRVKSLQEDLNNSELVQMDFVKLTQSLQMQLEQIRGSDKEVRWQHEDDAESCNSCRQAFSVTRRKHHCKHCGRIFCVDCTSKTVVSGNSQRTFKVCDVCHTLLCTDKAPYFSNEPPHTPD